VVDDLRCARCGEIIGIYEPTIVLAGEEIRETARAADDRLPVKGAAHYHRDCYAAITAEAPA
jgi:hypothetical protein